MTNRQWFTAITLTAIALLGVVAVIVLWNGEGEEPSVLTLSTIPSATAPASLVELEIRGELQAIHKTFPDPVWGLDVECLPMGQVNSFRCTANYRTRNGITEQIENFTVLYDAHCNGTNCDWRRI
jgi:hypothetical protein